MELKDGLTPQKIRLLQNLERNPYINDEELSNAIGYIYKSSVIKLKNFLEK